MSNVIFSWFLFNLSRLRMLLSWTRRTPSSNQSISAPQTWTSNRYLYISVSDPFHFDADPDPDPRIRFRDNGSGSGSGSESRSGSDLKLNKSKLCFFLNFFCIRFKTHKVVFLLYFWAYYSRILNKISDFFFGWFCMRVYHDFFFGTRIQINVDPEWIRIRIRVRNTALYYWTVSWIRIWIHFTKDEIRFRAGNKKSWEIT